MQKQHLSVATISKSGHYILVGVLNNMVSTQWMTDPEVMYSRLYGSFFVLLALRILHISNPTC